MTVFNIPVSSAIPYVAAVDKEMQKVAKEMGIKWVQFENQGNPTQWASGMNQAISQKADLIILRRGHRPEAAHPAAASGQGGEDQGPRQPPVPER